MDKFKYTLMNDEGFRSRVYLDHLGNPTIGYGTLISELEVSKEEAERWLNAELDEKEVRLRRIPEYDKLCLTRKNVIRSMAYQMGVHGTRNFKKMWTAIAVDDYAEAAAQMRDSRWHRDPLTRDRAAKMANRMFTGAW